VIGRIAGGRDAGDIASIEETDMLRTVIRRALASLAILFAVSPGAPARADTEVDLRS